MSPTHHSAPSTPSVPAYTTSSFANFALSQTTGPLYLVNPKSTPLSIQKSSPIDTSSFSCLSKGSSAELYNGNSNGDVQNGLFHPPRENNNWVEQILPKVGGDDQIKQNLQQIHHRSNGSHQCNGAAPKCSFEKLQTPSAAAAIAAAAASVAKESAAKEDEQSKEDERYLGAGGYSIWRGEGGKGCWVRKMGQAERFMTGCTEFGVMATVYKLTFESKMKIEFETIEEVSHIVARKLPHLRLVVGQRDNEPWWKEMDEPKVDVKELSNVDITNTFETLLKKRFDLENGPLWFVRFINIDSDDTATAADTQSDEKKFNFICMLGFHHNVSDGTTNMKFCNVFLKVLNDLLLGNEVDMKVEAKLTEPFHDRMSYKYIKDDYVKSKLWLFHHLFQRIYHGIIRYGKYTANFTNHYRQPAENEATTRVIPGELDEETTKRLLQRCREEKATLNSTFTAAANIALYKMALKHNPDLKETNFGGIHTINMRRYWTKEQSADSCGCHISTIDVKIPTAKDDITNFWDYARKVQDIMDHELNVSKRCIRLMALSERLRLILYTNSLLEFVELPAANYSHFLVTNMGNLEKVFPGTGEVVEVTKLMRSISCHYMPNLCQHTIHTFRGRLNYSLDYYTQKMEREHALLYAQVLTDTLKELSNKTPITCEL